MTTVLTMTGVTSKEDLKTSEVKPSFVVENLKALLQSLNVFLLQINSVETSIFCNHLVFKIFLYYKNDYFINCGEFILHVYKKYGTASSSVEFQYTKSSKRFEYFGSFEFVHVLAILVFTSPKIDIRNTIDKKINFGTGESGRFRENERQKFSSQKC